MGVVIGLHTALPAAHGLGRYFGSSIKASREVDWEEAASREAFLTEIIGEGERALELAREVRSKLEEGSEPDERIRAAAELLVQLLWSRLGGMEPTERGYRIREGTARDRVSLPKIRVETELLPSSTPTAGHMASLGFSPRGRNADECG